MDRTGSGKAGAGRLIAGVALLAVAGSLLVLSALADGRGEETWFAVGAALLGVLLGSVVPFVRAIFVDSFKRPTRHSILERSGKDGVRVRVADEPHKHSHAH